MVLAAHGSRRQRQSPYFVTQIQPSRDSFHWAKFSLWIEGLNGYHGEMNSGIFKTWFTQQLLPYPAPTSIIAKDNASIHWFWWKMYRVQTRREQTLWHGYSVNTPPQKRAEILQLVRRNKLRWCNALGHHCHATRAHGSANATTIQLNSYGTGEVICGRREQHPQQWRWLRYLGCVHKKNADFYCQC
jgi:hypothetical protein